MKKNGFTLVEIMIVLAIMLILTAIVVPRYSVNLNKAKDSKAYNILSIGRTNLSVLVAEFQGEVPSNDSGCGLWDGSTELKQFSNANFISTAMRIPGVDQATGNVTKENFGGEQPTFMYRALDANPEEGGKNIKYQNGTSDSKGINWGSY